MTRELVLLNGWGMTHAVWQPLAAALPDDLVLHRIDLHELASRGNGGVGDFAAAAAERAPRCCNVVAWSLGAQIALQWVQQSPAQVERLVLIAATPCFVERDDWKAGMELSVFEDFVSDVRNDASAALARFALLQARGDANAGAVARILRAVVCDDADHARPALLAGLECLRTADLRGSVRNVQQPAYLIHGAHDGLVPLAAAQRLRCEMPHAHLCVMPHASHAPHVSEPAALAAAIAEFLHEQ